MLLGYSIPFEMCVCKICLMLSDQTICPCLFAALDFIELKLKHCFVLSIAGIKCILEDVTRVLVIKNLFDALHACTFSIFSDIYSSL